MPHLKGWDQTWASNSGCCQPIDESSRIITSFLLETLLLIMHTQLWFLTATILCGSYETQSWVNKPLSPHTSAKPHHPFQSLCSQFLDPILISAKWVTLFPAYCHHFRSWHNHYYFCHWHNHHFCHCLVICKFDEQYLIVFFWVIDGNMEFVRSRMEAWGGAPMLAQLPPYA